MPRLLDSPDAESRGVTRRFFWRGGLPKRGSNGRSRMTGVDESVEAAFEAGRGAWPHLQLRWQQFQAQAHRVNPPAAGLHEHAADFYLAAACAAGCEAALLAFEQSYVARVPVMLTRFKLGTAALDDLKQRLRVRLLSGAPPRIASYAANGTLLAWVKVAAVRLAVDEQQRAHPLADGPAVIDIIDQGKDPEWMLLRGRYREQAERAFAAAIAELTPRSKTLLTLSYFDGRSIDAIGAIYGVHRATAARWLLEIRKSIMTAVQRELGFTLAADSREVRSLLHHLRDEIHISFKHILVTDGAADGVANGPGLALCVQR